jgi:hypothetical protein
MEICTRVTKVTKVTVKYFGLLFQREKKTLSVYKRKKKLK